MGEIFKLRLLLDAVRPFVRLNRTLGLIYFLMLNYFKYGLYGYAKR